MGNQAILILILASVAFLVAIIAFRKALYAWILLSGIVGLPLLVVRQSHLMLSEALIAVLLLLWFLERKLQIRLLKLPGISMTKVAIERPLWAMVCAFTISAIYNLVFRDSAIGAERPFLLGKLAGLFLYVASVMVALLVADVIQSSRDITTICRLLVIAGVFSFIADFQNAQNPLALLRRDIGWPWLSVSLLLSFSLSYLLFHPSITKKLQTILISFLILFQLLYAYFTGVATYKAVILANFIVVVVVFYFRSRRLAFLALCAGTIIILASSGLFRYYLHQETEEGAWGWHYRSRAAVLQRSLQIFAERPIFGVGPYNYYDYALHVAAKHGETDDWGWGVMTTPHNQYAQILAETGLIGALAFFWFLLRLFTMLRSLIKYHDDYQTRLFIAAIGAILVSRVLVAMLGDYVIPQYHNGGLQNFCSTVYFWISLGVLIGLQRLADRKITNDQSTSRGTLATVINTAWTG